MADPRYANPQWAVSDFGLEAVVGVRTSRMEGLTPPYQIAAGRLLETTVRDGETLYDWPVHMTEKSWVDHELFFDAFDAALKAHDGKYAGAVDQKMLSATLAYARKNASQE